MTNASPSTTTRGAMLADGVAMTKMLLARYLAGFNEVSHVRQTPDLPNHIAWILGHLSLTMHRVAAMIDKGELPSKDFIKADGFGGSRDKGFFDTEAVAFGSKPEERHDRFPSLVRCTEIYNAACDRLSTAVRNADDAALDAPVPWMQSQIPLYLLVMRMMFHNGFHTGQIADMRRALGFRPIM